MAAATPACTPPISILTRYCITPAPSEHSFSTLGVVDFGELRVEGLPK